MNLLKNKIKIIILIIVLMLISSSIGVLATYNYLASDVKYNDEKTVAQALDELYEKKKNYILPTGTENITSNGTYDVSEKANVNVNVPQGSASIDDFTGNFYICGDVRTNYSRFGYFDIDVKNYDKLEVNVGYIYNDSSVFTCYISTDGIKNTTITKIGKYELNVSENSIVRIYYYENSGYCYVIGTYTLSN